MKRWRGEETEGVMQMDTLIPRSLSSFREMGSLVPRPPLFHCSSVCVQ